MDHSTTSLIKEHIIKHNNLSACLIKSGEHKQAIVHLSHALRACRQFMDGSSSSPDERSEPIRFSLDEAMKQGTQRNGYAKEKTTTRGDSYLYSTPVPLCSESIGESYKEAVLVSTVLTFNLALATQLSSSDHQVKTRAARLYELAFSMQQQEGFDRNVIFVLSTVNNLGLLHRQIGNHAKSKNCFEHLLSTLMFLTDSSTRIECVDLEGFFRNVSPLIHQSTAVAAAA